MAFKEGISGNPNGRPKGSLNKATVELRNVITNFLAQRFEDIVSDFEQLEPIDRIKAYALLLQYGLPKLQATSTNIRFEDMSDEQLEEIMNRLINHHESN